MMLLTRTTPKYFRCQTEKIFNEFLFRKQTISNIEFLYFIYSSKLTSMHCFLGMKKQNFFSSNFSKIFHTFMLSEREPEYVQFILFNEKDFLVGWIWWIILSMSAQFRRQHHWEERGASAFFFPCYPMLWALKKESFTRFQVVAEETRALTDSWFRIQDYGEIMAALEGMAGGSLLRRRKSNFQKHLDNTFKAAAIMLPHQILNVGRVSLL